MKSVYVIFYLVLICSVKTLAQSNSECVLDDAMLCEPLDFFIMIDGKLPLETTTIIYFENDSYYDSITYYNTNNVHSYSIQREEIIQLCELIPDSAVVFIGYIFHEPIGYNQYCTHYYKDTLTWGVFKGIRIVLISNFNKKKNRYYIHYVLSPPFNRYLFYKREYGSPRHFVKKIFKGIYPLRFSIPDVKIVKGVYVPQKNGKGKSRPVYW